MAPPAAKAAPSTQTMYDPKSGSAVEVPVGEVRSAYLSGRLGFAPNQTVTVRDETGGFREIDAAQAPQFFTSRGNLSSNVASQADVREAQLEDLYGGVGGAALATGSRALSSATLGLSDVAITGAADVIGKGDQVREALAESQERNPFASGVGDVIGVVGPALLTGGASAGASAVEGGSLAARGARAISAPVRLANVAGEAAGAATTRALGTGAAGKIASAVAAGATENALQGVGEAARNAALRDEPLTIEALAASGLNAGIFGGLIGGGFGAAGAAAHGLGAAVKAGGEGAYNLGKNTLVKALGGAEEALEVGGKAATKADRALVERIEGLVEKVTGKPVKDLLDETSTSAALRSAGASEEQIARLGADARGMRTVLLDDLPRLVGKEPGDLLTRTEIKKASEAFASRERKALAATLSEADGAIGKLAKEGRDVRPDFARLVGETRRIADDFNAVAGGAERAKLASKVADDLEQKWAGKSLAQIHSERGFLSKAPAGSAGAEVYARVNELLDRWVDDSLERVSREAGSELALKAAAAKTGVARAQWLEEVTRSADGGVGLLGGVKDQVSALLGSNILSLLGGGPIALGSAALAYAGKRIASQYGDQFVANVAREAAVDGTLRGAVDAVKDRVRRGVSSAMARGEVRVVAEAAKAVGSAVSEGTERAGRAAAAGAGATVRGGTVAAYRWREDRERKVARAERTASAAVAYAANPGPVHEAMGAGLREVRPDVDASVAAHNRTSAEYLAAEAPKPALGPGLMRASTSKPPIDEVEKFERKVKAIKDPTSVLKFSKKPELASTDAVEALEATSPALHEQIRQDVFEQASKAKKGTTLDYKSAIRLSRISGLELDPTVNPGFGATMQSIYAAAEERVAQQAPRRAPTSGRSVASELAETPALRLQGVGRR